MVTMTVLYKEFPEEIHGEINGVCQKVSDDTYRCVIDSWLPDHKQKAALWHELAHVLLLHFDSPQPIEEIEAEADEFAYLMTGVSLHHDAE